MRRSGSTMYRRLRLSRYRFASSMSSIVNKYNFAFENDTIISIKSLTYSTPDGPKLWGEQSDDETVDISSKNTLQCQETIEAEKPNSDSEEDYTDNQSFEESHFTKLHEESHLSTDNKDTELASIKRNLENIHIKENIPVVCSSGARVKNTYRVEVDMLLQDSVSSIPKALMVTRTKTKKINQLSPLPEMENKSLIGFDKVQRKQLPSASLVSLEVSNIITSSSAHETILTENQSRRVNYESGYGSFLEMYESADENCSWNNVTIADMYPGMVKALSRLLHKVSHSTSSSSLIKRFKYKYWHSKKSKLNTSTERTRKFKRLKLKSSFVTENDGKQHKLPIENSRSNSPFYHCKHQTQHLGKNISTLESTVCQKSDRMEIDYSDITEDDSCSEKIRKNITEAICFPSTLYTEKTFLVKSTTCLPLSLDNVENNQSTEDYSHTICTVDSDTIFNPAAESKTEKSTTAFKDAPCLSLSFNNSTHSYLKSNKPSPAKTSNRLQGKHDMKTSSATISLPQRHSFSSFPVSQSPINVHQKHEDAFEKIYKELCSPNLQKPFKFSERGGSPRKSAEVHITSLNNFSSKFHKKTNMIEDMYQKLCSEGFPKIPTFLREASLKKYAGMQMSDTVNALVNSPTRILPASVSRIKRAGHFSNEDFQTSPLKRLKNRSDNSFPTVCQKPPYWKNIKTDATFILHSPVKNRDLTMNYGFSVSSDYCSTSVTDMAESRIANMNESIRFQSCDSPRKSQNYIPKVSRKLSYNDGKDKKQRTHTGKL